ncbi:MAG TPA: AAA family ATPase [Candidatus Limnocylindria bacterium]
MSRPLLVIVGGAPGAGKTTIARELAHRLHLAIITKDDVKEALGDALGVGDRQRSRELGGAAYAVMWSVARRALEAGAGLVLEANFYREISEPRLAELATLADAVVVLCRADARVRRRRYESRHDRHAVHTDAVILADEWREDDAINAIDVGVPRLVVDTTSGYDADAIVSWITRTSTT